MLHGNTVDCTGCVVGCVCVGSSVDVSSVGWSVIGSVGNSGAGSVRVTVVVDWSVVGSGVVNSSIVGSGVVGSGIVGSGVVSSGVGSVVVESGAVVSGVVGSGVVDSGGLVSGGIYGGVYAYLFVNVCEPVKYVTSDTSGSPSTVTFTTLGDVSYDQYCTLPSVSSIW